MDVWPGCAAVGRFLVNRKEAVCSVMGGLLSRGEEG